MEHYGTSSLCPLKYYIGGSLFNESALEIPKFGNSVTVCFFPSRRPSPPFRRPGNCVQSTLKCRVFYWPTNGEVKDDQVLSTYQYVIKLRERLEQTIS